MTNRLLAMMPPAIRSELEVAGGEFFLPAGQSISADLDGGYVFVVDAGIGSKLIRSEQGLLSEIGMVGPEGMFPIAALLQVPSACRLVVSQVGTLSGRRIRSREFHAIVGESAAARDLLQRYAYAFMMQVWSNMLTSEQDPVHKRLARWLLMCHDRIAGDDIAITHEMLAQIAFAQRPTVTNALNGLREDGIVGCARGLVRVLDRPALFRIADGAYGMSERYWNDHIGPFGKPVTRAELAEKEAATG